MLKTKDLSYHYPQSKRISFPDLEVKLNSTLLINGQSGCGKTTLLHLLAGLIKPSSGEIKLCDKVLNHLNSKAKDQLRGQSIGIIYQQSFFIESLSIMENLMLSPYAVSSFKAKENAHRLGIKNVLNKKPNQLSVGELQRASICRAMMNEPQLILADEPTSALDDKNCKEVLKLLEQEAELYSSALVIVSHDHRLKTNMERSITLETF